jgi:HEPN domain-containing protein
LETAKQINDFNGVASISAQSAEKFMKSIIESKCFNADSSILKSHNQRKLLMEIKDVYDKCPLSEKDYKWLGDFYFDARYPGDDFIIVTEEQAIECLALTNRLKDWIDLIEKKEEKKEKKNKEKEDNNSKEKEDLDKLSSFDL